MDIHKPKPWRGWPEFVKEIGTIVIGVLIALGAEQAVEKVHENRLSDEARAAVRAEIGLNLANIQRREQWQPCIDRRLGELSDLLARADRGEPHAPAQTIGNPGAPLIQTQRWEAATAGGRTSLLDLDEQRGFARIYTELAAERHEELAESDAWADLMALQGVTRPSPELLARAQVALAHARLQNWVVRNTLRQAVDFAGRIGVRPTPDLLVSINNQSERELLCMPISTPRAEAAKRIQDPLGIY